jgi:hemerythrin-like metal-binding protein
VLDEHHNKLFSLLNSVYENVMTSPDVNFILPIIDELSEYTRMHFSAEEQHMRDLGFKEIDAHTAKHRDFSNKLEIMKSHYHGNNLEAAQELMVVLGDWLLSHVIKEDIKYSTSAS